MVNFSLYNPWLKVGIRGLGEGKIYSWGDKVRMLRLYSSLFL